VLNSVLEAARSAAWGVAKLGFIAGLGGLPRWIPFLDRLAERRTVIVPSLPGYPGALGHNVLDNHLDWVLAVRELLAAADLDGADLAGSSVGAAFAAAGRAPASPSYLDPSLVVPSRPDSLTARRQDAISAMLWLGLNPDNTPRTQILMPPLYWDVQPTDAQSILTALATAIHAGLAVPRPLSALVTESEAAAVGSAPLEAEENQRGWVGDHVTTDIGQQVGRLWGLTAAMTTDSRTGLTGLQYTAPLREDMLRALSQAVPPDSRAGQAQQRMDGVDSTVNDMFHAVTIVNPGGSYTLATETSPLPLALRNDLAVPIKVRLQVDAPPGMTVTDIGVQELPPGYLPLRVPIEVRFTKRVAVDVTLRTPDGLALGEPVRLSVHSNAYGRVLFAITLAAAAVLVVLAGRRLWHRFRGQPDRADLDRPESV